MSKITVSSKIREWRKLNNVSQERFGDLVGVSPQAVSKWETDKSYPDITVLPKIAELLGCSVSDFFDSDKGD
ncbi:MAG: helix-turn-helix transcriptional regulator [Ruminococcaceae bacterium]|nr:helix-turn-helix transcriptional regulator [Oscillospiraceae bacterium]